MPSERNQTHVVTHCVCGSVSIQNRHTHADGTKTSDFQGLGVGRAEERGSDCFMCTVFFFAGGGERLVMKISWN